MSDKKYTNVYDEKIRRAEYSDAEVPYKAPNGTVPRTPPAKTKSLGEVVGSFFTKPKPAPKKK